MSENKTRTNPVAFHFRSKSVLERGGITVAYNPVTNRFGVAVCQKLDNFCRSQGFNRAVGRSKSSHKGIMSQNTNPTIDEIREQAQSIAAKAQREFNEHLQGKIDAMTRMMKSKLIDVSMERHKRKS